MIRSLRRWAGTVYRTARLTRGLVHFYRTGENLDTGHHAMVSSYFTTDGLSNDLLSRLFTVVDPRYEFRGSEGVLAKEGEEGLARAARLSRRDGYYRFPERLDSDLCRRLLDFALRTPCEPHIDPEPEGDVPMRPYGPERARPIATRYWFPYETVVQNPDAQDLMADPTFLRFAQAYLGGPVVLKGVTMWWLTSYAPGPSSQAGQLFHNDMDCVRWINLWMYLTDVTTENAPHCMVRGTHRRGTNPFELRKRGYARIPDEDILKHFRPDQVVEFTGPSGTIWAGDSRGYHKGKAATRGDRLMFSLLFANSHFGANYPKVPMREIYSERLAEAIRRYPRVYARYVDKSRPPRFVGSRVR